MLSIQARLVRLFLKANWREKPLELDAIPKYRADFERNMRLLFPTLAGRYVKRRIVAGVPVEEIIPNPSPRHTILYVHGGAFALGSSRAYRQHLVRTARMCNANILSVDYSLSPEHPFPYAPNQIIQVWQELQAQGLHSSEIAWMGDSAGANIILSAALKLRDEHQSLPACLILLSPALDATFRGESYTKNRYKDLVLTVPALDFYMKLYVQDNDKKNPYVSPVFASLKALPPMLIHVGSGELQFSSSQTLFKHAQRDGVDAELFIGQRLWHGWHVFAGVVPEARSAMRRISAFMDERVGAVPLE